MVLSRPMNAPPQMNKIFSVLTWIYSWWGCFLPPCGGTLQVDPSRIFSNACCTPSPDTSDRKSTRLNSSHSQISYAVFCLKKKKENNRAHDYHTRTLRC